MRTCRTATRPTALRAGTIQDAEDSGVLDAMSRDRRYASWHVVDADGEVVSAGKALTKVLSVLPVGRPLAALTGVDLVGTADRKPSSSPRMNGRGRPVGRRPCCRLR